MRFQDNGSKDPYYHLKTVDWGNTAKLCILSNMLPSEDSEPEPPAIPSGNFNMHYSYVCHQFKAMASISPSSFSFQ